MSRLFRRNFRNFIFVEWRDALTTPLPVDGCTPHVNQRNDTERQNKEASLFNNSLVFLQRHLGGRQTVENHLVHTGTSSCRRAHILMSSISILVNFFAVFIFVEAGMFAKIVKICTQPLYSIRLNLIPLQPELCTRGN